MPEWRDESADFLELTRKISAERGFGCASYKDKCLRRRIGVRMRARGVECYADYAHLLDADAAEYERLIDALTINVTKLFRNWDVYAAVAQRVIPALWDAAAPTIRVWSAGCSSGDEAYSLAILFHRHAAANDMLTQTGRVAILGTDIDRESLAAAERAEFEENDFADTPPELRAAYFLPRAPFTPSPAIRALVRFERRDLLKDPAPPGAHQLILCRNVLIYFGRETQERVLDLFSHALEPGGYLVLGKVETVLGRIRSRFTAVDSRERIYKRL